MKKQNKIRLIKFEDGSYFQYWNSLHIPEKTDNITSAKSYTSKVDWESDKKVLELNGHKVQLIQN